MYFFKVTDIMNDSTRTQTSKVSVKMHKAEDLDLFEEPTHPHLLLLGVSGHQQHVLGRGGVVRDLAGSHHVAAAAAAPF